MLALIQDVRSYVSKSGSTSSFKNKLDGESDCFNCQCVLQQQAPSSRISGNKLDTESHVSWPRIKDVLWNFLSFLCLFFSLKHIPSFLEVCWIHFLPLKHFQSWIKVWRIPVYLHSVFFTASADALLLFMEQKSSLWMCKTQNTDPLNVAQ